MRHRLHQPRDEIETLILSSTWTGPIPCCCRRGTRSTGPHWPQCGLSGMSSLTAIDGAPAGCSSSPQRRGSAAPQLWHFREGQLLLWDVLFHLELSPTKPQQPRERRDQPASLPPLGWRCATAPTLPDPSCRDTSRRARPGCARRGRWSSRATRERAGHGTRQTRPAQHPPTSCTSPWSRRPAWRAVQRRRGWPGRAFAAEPAPRRWRRRRSQVFEDVLLNTATAASGSRATIQHLERVPPRHPQATAR